MICLGFRGWVYGYLIYNSVWPPANEINYYIVRRAYGIVEQCIINIYLNE